jgi:uncharacterized membrane protein
MRGGRSTRDAHRFLGNKIVMAMIMALCCALWPTSMMNGATAFRPSSNRCSMIIDIINTNRNMFPSTRQLHATTARPITRISLFDNNDNGADGAMDPTSGSTNVWSPGLRKIMAGVAGLGALETGFLTYSKVANQAAPSLFCGNSQSAAASCDQVLNGPYSNFPFFENFPLAALGLVAYSSIVVLALQPLVVGSNSSSDDDDVVDDTQNRILLTALATAMGTFSIFLMTLLFGVLQASCPYCVFSAADSFMLANLALIGGCLPEGTLDESKKGGKTVAVGFAGAVVGAVLLFGSGSIDAINTPGSGASSNGSTVLLASTISGSGSKAAQQDLLYAAPEITTESSERALKVGKSLQQMDAKMYGAHWCSHCYDQKQTLGKQVFDKTNGFVEYVECSKDGINSSFKICKAKEIPGYPN